MRVMDAIAPLQIGVARDAAEVDALVGMRSREAIARGWVEGTAGFDGADRDAYDDDAVHIVIRDGNRVVGGFRLILPLPARPLPIETAFGLSLEPAGRFVQWGRLILAPEYRGDRNHLLPLACFAAIWLETTRRGFDRVAGVVSHRLKLLYEGMGWDFTILGPPRKVDGESRYPAMTNTETIRSGVEVLGGLLDMKASA